MTADDDALRRHTPSIVAALALIAYANALPDGFVFDDARAVLHNPVVQGAFSAQRLFTSDYWGGRVGHGVVVGSFRPLVSLLFWCLWRVGHGAPMAFHLVNALLHALASGLFARWFTRHLPGALAPLIAAGWFALHPLHTDAVTSIVGCADVLAFVLTLVAWRFHTRDTPGAVAASLAAFSLSLLTKESAVVLPALLVVADASARRPITRALLARYASYALSVAALIAWRRHVFGDAQAFYPDRLANPLVDAHGLSRALTVLSLFGTGISLLIAPLELLPDRGRAITTALQAPTTETFVGALALAALVATLVHATRTKNTLRAQSAAWIALHGLLAVNAVVLLPTAFAERLWYLPSAGAAWLVGEGAAWLQTRASRRAVASIGALLGVCLLALTWRQNGVWRDEERLYAAAVQTDPRGAAMQFNLAAVRYDQRRFEESIARCHLAARLAPAWPDPHGCIGLAFEALGRPREAERAYQTMLAMPGATVHWCLLYVDLLRREGRFDEARRLLTSMRARGVRAAALREASARVEQSDAAHMR